MDFLKNFPDQRFVSGRFFMWSPVTSSITFDKKRLENNNGKIALLHELGHARLGHRSYKYDMELLTMEMDAWDIVRDLAPQFGLKIDERHIERCISTYDRWLSKRATCPDCQNFSLQKDRQEFQCFACGSLWSVNYRKDRRVTRKVITRWQHPFFDLDPSQVKV